MPIKTEVAHAADLGIERSVASLPITNAISRRDRLINAFRRRSDFDKMSDVGHVLLLRCCFESGILTGVTLHSGNLRRYRGGGLLEA